MSTLQKVTKWIFEKKKKADNRGLTLVELVCAMAILGLIGTGVGSVLIVSANNYNRGNNEVTLQQEAQMTANQLENLVVDATEQIQYTCTVGGTEYDCVNEAQALSYGAIAGGDRTLKIKQGDRLYVVAYQSANQQIVYSEYIVAVDGSTSTVATNQLMTENVTAFSADLSGFAESRSLQLSLSLEKSGRTYSSSYTITARNGMVTTAAEAVAATITTESEIVLEPSQVYPLEATVVGPADTSVTWTMSGNTSSSTCLALNPSTGKMEIRIATDERASDLYLMVKTVAKKEDGVTPLAQMPVTVHIRRVTAVTLTGELESGTALSAGAVYKITANVSGTYLDQVPATAYDADYKETRDVQWSYLVTNNGYEVGGPDWSWELPSGYYTVLDSSEDGSVSSCYTRIRLERNLENTIQILVTAVATHPEGEVTLADGVTTRQTNKTAIAYDHVFGTYWLFRNYWDFNGGMIKRGSDDSQGSFTAFGALKGMLIAQYGNGDYKARKEYRYREIIYMDPVTGARTYGPWTSWVQTPQNVSDQDINLRPVVTSRFECNKDYQVQIRLSVYDTSNGNVLWPAADTPESAYLIDAEVLRIKPTFNSWDFGFTDATQYGTEAAPMVIAMNGATEVEKTLFSFSNCNSIKVDNIKDRVRGQIQKLEGGVWVDAGSSAGFVRNNDVCIAKFYETGTYRVLITAENIPYVTYNPATDTYIEGSKNYNLYDEATGSGIFYYKVQ
ncbi:MAG: type II secretion system protein [Lachnospiraceae bacterium]|nr:type II secretion system protein [Lachnospiraceae bacterium]